MRNDHPSALMSIPAGMARIQGKPDRGSRCLRPVISLTLASTHPCVIRRQSGRTSEEHDTLGAMLLSAAIQTVGQNIQGILMGCRGFPVIRTSPPWSCTNMPQFSLQTWHIDGEGSGFKISFPFAASAFQWVNIILYITNYYMSNSLKL